MPTHEPDQPEPHTNPHRAGRRKKHFLWRAMVLSRARRRWRWGLRILIALPLALIAALIVLTHSPLTRHLLLPRIAEATGLNVDANWVHIRRDGTVVVDNAELTIPGLPGDAGRFLRIARVEAEVDWWKTIRGHPAVGRVTMTDPVLVVSQSLEDGSLNVGSIRAPSGAKSGMSLPTITATNVGLELGEHGKGAYTALRRIQMDGSLTPTPDTPGTYTLTLYETLRRVGVASRRNATGFTLGGTVSDGRIDLKLLNFSLTDWPPSTLPASIREISDNLALSGDVTSARFVYTRDEGITASMDLKGVAMNLPLEASVQGPVFEPTTPADQPPPSPRFMRMSGVEGTITFARDSVLAKVGGLIEDLPYEVTLRYDGVEDDSPFNLDFVSKDFTMSRNPELLLYAPPTVKFYLKTFLMPTGIVTSHVNVRRGPPSPPPGPAEGPRQPGPITVSGSMDFREGTAAYESFPYEFNDMTGRFEFDNNQIKIVSVTGQSKTGARLQAHGSIGPLDETSEVDVHVSVSNAQIDEAMEAAFGPGRAAALTALFNDQRHQELVDLAIIRTPEQGEAEALELDKLRSTLPTLAGDEAAKANQRIEALIGRAAIPVFPFRGQADVTVHVFSARGVNMPYQTSVDVFLPKAGLVPEKFPYPLIAENVSVEVRDKKGRIAFGTFRGLCGGRADVDATFSVPGKGDDGPTPLPEITIHAADLPLDEFLIHALPGEDSPAAKSPSKVKRILRDIGIAATASGEVHIGARSASATDMGFDANVAITSGEIRPKAFGSSASIAVAGVNGRFEASETSLFLDIDGLPVLPPAMEADLVGPPIPLEQASPIGGTLTVHVRAEFPPSLPSGEPQDPSFFVHSTCPGFDMSSPVESLIGVFSPKAATAVDKARAEFHPAGFVDIRLQAESGAASADEMKLRVNLASPRSLGADFLGARAIIPEAKGSVTLQIGEKLENGTPAPPMAKFDAVSGSLLFGGQPAGIAAIDGALPIEAGPGAPDVALEVSLLDGRFESTLTRAILEQLDAGKAGGGDATSLYSRLGPAGLFDATMVVRPDRSRDGTPLIAQGRLEPRSLVLNLKEAKNPVEFTAVGGSIEFEPGSGVLRELRLEAPDWAMRADGAWTLGADAVTFRSSISGRGGRLSDDLRALLPEELRSLLDQLELRITGPFQLTDAALDVQRGKTAFSRFSGKLDFSGASLEAGVPISEMDGRLLISFESGESSPTFRLDLSADRFQVSGITLTNGTAVVQNGSIPGQVRVADASGFCHGGRFHVSADVTPDGPEPQSPRRFNAAFQIAGVRFNTLLREIVDSVKPFIGPPSPGESDPAPATMTRREEFSRGLLDAELTLEGLVSDPKSRRGRGTLRVSGGRVLNLPFMTGLIEAGNLQFPFNSSLDYAWGSLFVEGPLITFEDLTVQSRAIEISGGGTMSWPGRELNLRFQTRSARPIPILSAIVQGIRHQVMVIAVTGKLGEQSVKIRAPGPTRMLETVVGAGDGPRPPELDRAGSASDRERDRSRRRGIRPALPVAPSTPEVIADEQREGP